MLPDTAATRFHKAIDRLGRLLAERDLERRYNPDWASQPRVPSGNPGGGRWTDGGPSIIGEELNPSAFEEPVSDEPIGEEPPDVPTVRPEKARRRSRYVKKIARWLLQGTRVGVRLSPIGRALDIYEAGLWIYDHWSFIEAYQDKPKSLGELRAAASQRRKGYDIHHIVERASALEDDFPLSRVDGAENLVSIPTLKHWELNRWYEMKNPNFGWLTPRQYARGKDWPTRLRLGLDGLRDIGVLER